MESHVQVLPGQEETTLKEEKVSWEACSEQNIHCFSLAESLPGKKRLFFPVGLGSGWSVWELPLLASWLYLIEVPIVLPGESNGQRNLMGYNLQGHIELDMTGATNTVSV